MKVNYLINNEEKREQDIKIQPQKLNKALFLINRIVANIT